MGLGLSGLRSSLSLANVNSEIASLKERQRDATARFSASTGLPDGVSEKQLISRFQALTGEFEAVSVQSIDVFAMVAQLVDEGVYITGLSGEITAIPTKDGKRAALNTVDAALYDGVDETKEGEVLVKVSVTATSDSPARLTAWAQKVRERGVFRNLVVVRNANVYTLTGLLVQDEAPSAILNSFAASGLPVALGGRTADDNEGAANADGNQNANEVGGDTGNTTNNSETNGGAN